MIDAIIFLRKRVHVFVLKEISFKSVPVRFVRERLQETGDNQEILVLAVKRRV